MTSSRRHSAKGLSKTFDNSVVAMVIDLIGVDNCIVAMVTDLTDVIGVEAKSLKIWWSMAWQMLHQIFSDFIN